MSKAWKPEEDAELLRCVAKGYIKERIATKLGRSRDAINRRLRELRAVADASTDRTDDAAQSTPVSLAGSP